MKQRSPPEAFMNPEHPQWSLFIDLLEGPRGINRGTGRDGDLTWDCDCLEDFPLARGLLQSLGFSPSQISASLVYFTTSGCGCDCDVIELSDDLRVIALERERFNSCPASSPTTGSGRLTVSGRRPWRYSRGSRPHS